MNQDEVRTLVLECLHKPTGTSIIREEACWHLIPFPHFLRKVYDMIEWLGKNKALS
jgi:hypothetical protein